MSNACHDPNLLLSFLILYAYLPSLLPSGKMALSHQRLLSQFPSKPMLPQHLPSTHLLLPKLASQSLNFQFVLQLWLQVSEWVVVILKLWGRPGPSGLNVGCSTTKYCVFKKRMHHSFHLFLIWNGEQQLITTLLIFTFSGLTIDTTAASLAPSNEAGSVPGLRSLMQKMRQKRQRRSSDVLNYDFHSERSKWLRIAIHRARESISIPSNTSKPHKRTTFQQQVSS